MSPDMDARAAVRCLPEHFPVVLLNCAATVGNVNAIGIENFEGARAMVRHFVARGHRRIAIIARAVLDDETLVVTNPVSVVYQARIPLTILGQPLPITRGYSTVDVQFRGKWTRFDTTHLEAYSDVVRKAQTAEFVNALSTSPYDVIIVGDLNSLRTSSGDSWQILTGAGYTDVWTETMLLADGFTASFGDDLVGPPSELDHTVDYILRRSVSTLAGILSESEVVGEEIADQTSTGLWPSDHAGVYAVVRIVKD